MCDSLHNSEYDSLIGSQNNSFVPLFHRLVISSTIGMSLLVSDFERQRDQFIVCYLIHMGCLVSVDEKYGVLTTTGMAE
jgi:hypothetical protein